VIFKEDSMQFHRFRFAGVALALAASGACAQPLQVAGEQWWPVATRELDVMRGGFTLAGGLAVSFGLERLVEVNGNVVAQTSLRIPDLGHMTAEQAQQARDALSAVKLIQVGSGNIYNSSAPGQMLGGTVIQNSLDGQVIRSQTVISGSVNSLSLLNEIGFQRTLAASIAGAASPP
jgi:hypothetical protein